jgi:hypothetical protein
MTHTLSTSNGATSNEKRGSLVKGERGKSREGLVPDLLSDTAIGAKTLDLDSSHPIAAPPFALLVARCVLCSGEKLDEGADEVAGRSAPVQAK